MASRRSMSFSYVAVLVRRISDPIFSNPFSSTALSRSTETSMWEDEVCVEADGDRCDGIGVETSWLDKDVERGGPGRREAALMTLIVSLAFVFETRPRLP